MWMLYPGLVHLASPVDSLLWLFIPNLRLIMAEMMNLAFVIRLFPNILIDAWKSYLPGGYGMVWLCLKIGGIPWHSRVNHEKSSLSGWHFPAGSFGGKSLIFPTPYTQ